MLLILFGLALLVAPLPTAAASTVTAMKNAAWLMVGRICSRCCFPVFFSIKDRVDRQLRSFQ
jgi:hypothetical protein